MLSTAMRAAHSTLALRSTLLSTCYAQYAGAPQHPTIDMLRTARWRSAAPGEGDRNGVPTAGTGQRTAGIQMRPNFPTAANGGAKIDLSRIRGSVN